MFEVGDKVRYVPNEDSPRNASTDAGYTALGGREGVVEDAGSGWFTYRYLVSFDGGELWWPFSEAELKVA